MKTLPNHAIRNARSRYRYHFRFHMRDRNCHAVPRIDSKNQLGDDISYITSRSIEPGQARNQPNIRRPELFRTLSLGTRSTASPTIVRIEVRGPTLISRPSPEIPSCLCNLPSSSFLRSRNQAHIRRPRKVHMRVEAQHQAGRTRFPHLRSGQLLFKSTHLPSQSVRPIRHPHKPSICTPTWHAGWTLVPTKRRGCLSRDRESARIAIVGDSITV